MMGAASRAAQWPEMNCTNTVFKFLLNKITLPSIQGLEFQAYVVRCSLNFVHFALQFGH